jgi:hypothetical protein
MNTTVLFFTCAFGFLTLVALGVIIPTVRSDKRKSEKIRAEFIKQFD